MKTAAVVTKVVRFIAIMGGLTIGSVLSVSLEQPVVDNARDVLLSGTNPHGAVLRRLHTQADGGQVYEVLLRVKEHEGSDGFIERKGRLVTYDDALGSVVISHGFMCDKFDVGFLRTLFADRRFNSLTFDFRAHGENRGNQCCTFGRDEAFDVIAAAQFLKQVPSADKKPLFAYGFSMGAAASIEAQAKEPLFDAMILDCPFDSSESIIQKCLDNIQFSFFGYTFSIPGKSVLRRYAFHPYVQSMIKTMLKAVAQLDPHHVNLFVYPVSPVESAKKISVPCFYIHCKHDEKITVDAIRRIYDQTSGAKKLWVTNGRHHFDSYFYNPEEYATHVRHFVAEVLNGCWGKKCERQLLEDPDDRVRL